jgi:hypothetical protein
MGVGRVSFLFLYQSVFTRGLLLLPGSFGLFYFFIFPEQWKRRHGHVLYIYLYLPLRFQHYYCEESPSLDDS